MATVRGKDGVVKSGSDNLAEVTGFSLSITAEVADDTSYGDEWRTHQPTFKAWTASVDCWWDASDTAGQGAFTEGASVTVALHPEGEGAGTTSFSGTATITGVEIASELEGIVSASFSLTGNGELTKAAA